MGHYRDIGYEEAKLSEARVQAKGRLDGNKTLVSPICRYCKHIYSTLARTCAAYPKGIPEEIWKGLHNHQSPYPGDLGVQFEPHEMKEEELLAQPEKR